MTTYVLDARTAFLAAIGDTEYEWVDEQPLLDLYTLLVLTVGERCRCADIHNAWTIACQRTRPEHASLVPFDQLSPEVRAYDVKFRDAVRIASTRLVFPAIPP